MAAVLDAIDGARMEILIADWQLVYFVKVCMYVCTLIPSNA